jgi:hypothetical protein
MSDRSKKRTAKPAVKYKFHWYIQDFWESLEFVAPRKVLWIAMISGSVIAVVGFALILVDLDILDIQYDSGLHVSYVTGQERQKRQELAQAKASNSQAEQAANRGRFEELPHTWSGLFSGEINYWGPLGGCRVHYYDNKVTVLLAAYDETVNSGEIELIMKGQLMIVLDMQWRGNDLRQCMEQIGKNVATMSLIYGMPLRQESMVRYEGTFSFDDSSHDGTILSVSLDPLGCHGDRCRAIVGKIVTSPSGQVVFRSDWWSIILSPGGGPDLAR